MTVLVQIFSIHLISEILKDQEIIDFVIDLSFYFIASNSDGKV
jgi:hypothetical protein